MGVLVGEGRVSNVSARAVFRCLGGFVGFYNLEEWSSVKLGFETLVKFSIDRCPKVLVNMDIYVFSSL